MPYGWTTRAPSNEQYTIKVTLLGSKPPIWRRLVVPADLGLDSVHWAIQVAFEWTNSHLHQFALYSGTRMARDEEDALIRAGRDFDQNAARGLRYFSDPAFGLENTEDENRFELRDFAAMPKAATLTYIYDMGDGWEHQIKIEKTSDVEPGSPSVVCLAGKLAPPPDDSGGIYGYADLVGALADESHEGHDDAVEWLGADFDPARFDLDGVNKALRKMFRPWPKPRKKK